MTFEEAKDAINKEVRGSILFFKSILKIANIASPAPILSTGLELNEGQKYLFNL